MSETTWEDLSFSTNPESSASPTVGQEEGMTLPGDAYNSTSASFTATSDTYYTSSAFEDRSILGTTGDVYDETTALDDNESDSFWNQLPFAHEYWHQFDIEAIPVEYHYAVAIWMTFFGLLGVVGNLLVIYTFIRSKRLRTPPNMLIVNLAVSDLGFTIVNGFPLLTISSINKIWKWGDMWCQLYGYGSGIFGFGALNSLVAIAVDRYRIVSKPLQAAISLTKKSTARTIVLIWLWALLWSTPPMLGWGRYLPEGFQTSCTFDYLSKDIGTVTFLFGIYIGNFLLPVTIIAYCYIGIVRSLAKQHREMQKTAERMGANAAKADKHRKQEVQVAKVGALSFAAFLLSWMPYAVVTMMGLAFSQEQKMITPYLAEIPCIFAKAAASYNPVIYAVSHPAYRAEIYQRFPWLLCCCKPDTMTAYRRESESIDMTVSAQTDNKSAGRKAARKDRGSVVNNV